MKMSGDQTINSFGAVYAHIGVWFWHKLVQGCLGKSVIR